MCSSHHVRHGHDDARDHDGVHVPLHDRDDAHYGHGDDVHARPHHGRGDDDAHARPHPRRDHGSHMCSPHHGHDDDAHVHHEAWQPLPSVQLPDPWHSQLSPESSYHPVHPMEL